MMDWSSLATAGLSAVTGLAGQGMTNMMQADMMQQQMQFQERMSSTAYQRAAQDMKAAGLNPMMMAHGGMNASSPAGSPASPLVKSGLDADAVQKAISTGLQAATTTAQIENIQAQTNNTKADTLIKLVTPENVKAHTGLTRQQENTSQALSESIRLGFPMKRWEGTVAGDLLSINSAVRRAAHMTSWGAGEVGKILRPINDTVSTATSALRNVRRPPRMTGSNQRSVDEYGNVRTQQRDYQYAE